MRFRSAFSGIQGGGDGTGGHAEGVCQEDEAGKLVWDGVLFPYGSSRRKLESDGRGGKGVLSLQPGRLMAMSGIPRAVLIGRAERVASARKEKVL